jgi:hypothetical protein
MLIRTNAMPAQIRAVPAGPGSILADAQLAALRTGLAAETTRVQECTRLYALYTAEHGPFTSDDGTEDALVHAIRVGKTAEVMDMELAEACGEPTS